MMNSEELGHWLAARCGKLTASRMADALDFRKDGKPGADRVKLMKELLAERMTGVSAPHFVNDLMRWGLEHEPEAKAAYEAECGVLLSDGRYFDHPEIDNLGATPDGLIDHDGLVETKCPQTTTHLDYVMAGVVPDQYKPQMLVQLACTGRSWCDFVSYDPRIKVHKRRLFIVRFEPTADDVAAIESAARVFLAELDAMFEQVVTA